MQLIQTECLDCELIDVWIISISNISIICSLTVGNSDFLCSQDMYVFLVAWMHTLYHRYNYSRLILAVSHNTNRHYFVACKGKCSSLWQYGGTMSSSWFLRLYHGFSMLYHGFYSYSMLYPGFDSYCTLYHGFDSYCTLYHGLRWIVPWILWLLYIVPWIL